VHAIDQQLAEHLRAAIGRLMDAPWEGPVPVEVSNRPDLADYASPVAFALAGRLRRSPMEIASALAADLAATAEHLLASVEAAPPAFINLRLSDAFLGEMVALARRKEGRIADHPSDAPPKAKVVLEHTNINPNKAAHVGHFRNACIGDTVARMLRRRGHPVEVQNYIDDTGVQVADVVVGLRFLDVAERGEEPFDRYCSEVYVRVQQEYERDPALLERRAEVQHAIESGQGELAEFALATAQQIAACNLATMARADIRYDLLTWESDILALGFWQSAFERLHESEAIHLEQEGPNHGCWVVPFGVGTVETEQGTVTEDKVLVTSRGTVTYTAKDIAYQMWKFGVLGKDFEYRLWGTQHDGSPLWSSTRSADTARQDAGHDGPPTFAHGDRVINVIDDRQSYPQQVVYDCLRRMGFEREAQRSEHLAYAVVSLSVEAAQELGVSVEEGARKVAMSGRGGIQVYADQLLDRLAARIEDRATPETAEQVAAAAARYYMLKFGNTQEIVFDFEDALRTTGETGVYLQYAHVRAGGIARKLEEEARSDTPPASGVGPFDRALLLRMIDYPRVLDGAAQERQPLALAKYAFELAAAFSSFYDNTPPMVAEADLAQRAWRLALVDAFRLVLADVLDVLGIPTIERL
jgi:arginyl-tRNA synthetase